MLQEEVLEELVGQEQRTSQQQESLLGELEEAEGPAGHPEGDGEEVNEDDESEDAPPSEDGEEPQEPPPGSEEGEEDGPVPEEGDDEEPEDEKPPMRPSNSRPGGAPPPPPPPPPPMMKSALGEGLLGALKSGAAGAALKKVEAPAEARVDERTHLLRSIQLGAVQLKSAAAKPKPFQKIDVKVSRVFRKHGDFSRVFIKITMF